MVPNATTLDVFAYRYGPKTNA